MPTSGRSSLPRMFSCCHRASRASASCCSRLGRQESRSSSPARTEWIDDVPVRRFPVLNTRAWDFKLYERRAFSRGHTLEDERTFVDAQGPYAPDLLDHLWRNGRDADHLLFFTYIYYPTVRGLPLMPDRAVLVPTAHDEPALRLSIYEPVFHAPRAIAFNTDEERALVHGRFPNARIPNDILAVGVEVPA